MNAIELLTQQHREVRELLEKLERGGKGASRQSTFEKLADAIAVHNTIEEELFYPMALQEGIAELTYKAEEEHLACKRILADLLDEDYDEGRFGAKIAVLKDLVLHHVEEEERVFFPSVLRKIGHERIEQIGQHLEERAKMLWDEGDPREYIPEEIELTPTLQ
jgi:hemerythrin-like domain-containing protein